MLYKWHAHARHCRLTISCASPRPPRILLGRYCKCPRRWKRRSKIWRGRLEELGAKQSGQSRRHWRTSWPSRTCEWLLFHIDRFLKCGIFFYLKRQIRPWRSIKHLFSMGNFETTCRRQKLVDATQQQKPDSELQARLQSACWFVLIIGVLGIAWKTIEKNTFRFIQAKLILFDLFRQNFTLLPQTVARKTEWSAFWKRTSRNSRSLLLPPLYMLIHNKSVFTRSRLRF